MVAERAGVVHPVPLAAHHLEEVVEAGLVVVEDEDLLPGIDELLHHEVLAPPDELVLRVHDGLQEPQVLKQFQNAILKGSVSRDFFTSGFIFISFSPLPSLSLICLLVFFRKFSLHNGDKLHFYVPVAYILPILLTHLFSHIKTWFRI